MIKNTNITETHVKINFKERNQTFDSSLQNLCLTISTFNTYHAEMSLWFVFHSIDIKTL